MTSTIEIEGFAGQLIEPHDEVYDDARRVWNVLHDRRPALIARCATATDVAAALAYARQHDLVVAVRGGGHSLPGFSVCDDGLVVDLGAMNRVDVDAESRRVTVGGGALLGDVDRAAQRHGLVVPAGVISHTGVGGLTLGGGVGRLMRRFGLTIDSLLSVDLVTWDGRRLHASATERPELFWALRGGGGNFGVVTQFEFTAHPLTDIAVLGAFHPMAELPEVLAIAREVMEGDAPDALLWTSFVRKAPSRPWLPEGREGDLGLTSVIEWSGEPEEGEEVLAALRSRLGSADATVETVPYLMLQQAGDVEFGHGLMSYVKATFADSLTDDIVAALVERGSSLGSPLTQIEVLSTGGAIRQVPVDATAFPHRTASWLLNIPASWTEPDDTDREKAWVRETFETLAPLGTGGAYSNFMEGDEQGGATVAYGDLQARLAQVKREYDPHNVFRLNQNIVP
ncbi:FAD-binding oxidoreductase [Nocardioides mangrovicus]|uniref:FAD-binding oxidoreductase n=1 Tax=Nocardioides mangrovicus TaxID=2478913 RepID=A0A3L8P5N6_9ACTN|nr:FAD-binding oxidoreductase [Nocardioides mangrovicus]RLV49969.1 FAD-binding oxidoreductase [Nocardioides mangrovicus]